MEQDLLDALEPDQWVSATSQPLPRRQFTRGVLTLLIALRVYVLIAIPIVIYAFVHALLTPQ